MFLILRAVMTVMCILGMSVGLYAHIQDQANKSATIMPEVLVTSKQEKTSMVVPDLEQAKEDISKIAGGVDLIAVDDYKTGRATNHTRCAWLFTRHFCSTA